MREILFGLGALTWVVMLLSLAFLTPLSAPVAYGLALLCALTVMGTARYFKRGNAFSRGRHSR